MKKVFTGLVAAVILSSSYANSHVVGDINDDGKIDTSEAIFGLQVAAGLYPAVTPSCLLSGKGNWITSTIYTECDVVTSAGESYVCNTSHLSSKGGFGDDEAKWDLLSLKGDKGDPGTDGAIPTVYSSGHAWMDRNLGASRVATSSTDADAYGDLYQWGRYSDGHQKRDGHTSFSYDTSDKDAPGHGLFIIPNSSFVDWRDPQNDNLWQGSGINNPCPPGFRLPTELEWVAEMDTWDSNNSAGAFGSPLKLVMAGYRNRFNGSINDADSYGDYWSSTGNGSSASVLYFGSGDADISSYYRASGFSVRCLKD